MVELGPAHCSIVSVGWQSLLTQFHKVFEVLQFSFSGSLASAQQSGVETPLCVWYFCFKKKIREKDRYIQSLSGTEKVVTCFPRKQQVGIKMKGADARFRVRKRIFSLTRSTFNP